MSEQFTTMTATTTTDLWPPPAHLVQALAESLLRNQRHLSLVSPASEPH